MLAVTTVALAGLASVDARRVRDPEAAAPRGVLPSWSVARWAANLRNAATRVREPGDRAAIDVLRATHAAMRSGVPVVAALRIALDRVPLAGRAPFDEALRTFELRGTTSDSTGSTERRTRLALDALRFLAASDVPASRGAALLGSVADRLTFERRLAEEVRERSAGARAQIVVLALLVPALAVYLAVTMPGLAATLGSPLGRFVLVPLAAVLEIAGIVASRAIIRSVVP